MSGAATGDDILPIHGATAGPGGIYGDGQKRGDPVAGAGRKPGRRRLGDDNGEEATMSHREYRQRGHAVRVSVALGLALAGFHLAGCTPTQMRVASDPTTPGDATTEALAAARASAEAYPSEPYYAHQVAVLELEQGQTAAAEASLAAALERDPAYAPSLSLLSKLYYDAARFEEGIVLLQDGRARLEAAGQPFPDELRGGLALHHAAIGDVEAAEELIIPLRRDGPHWMTLGSVLTYVTLQGDDFKTAPRLAERALRAGGETAANLNNQGISLLQVGDPAGAREAFLRALEIDPDLAAAMYNLAIVEKFYFFDEEKAKDWFGQYAARSEQDPDELRVVFGAQTPQQSTVVGDSQ